MKCLILAAGYATRLYPLTKNFPKPLLTVGEKTILDWLIDDVASFGIIDEYAVISNHRFASSFDTWAKTREETIVVVDDGTETNETRLGAVADMAFAMDERGYDDDLLVLAGDNVLDFSLASFLHYAKEKKTSCIMRYYESEEAKLSKSGVVEIGDNDVVLSMEEKPKAPKSPWCVPPFYIYTREDAGKIKEGIASGCSVDAPGSFAAWLCRHSIVHAMEMKGHRFDIGNLLSYEKVKRDYHGIESFI